MNELINDEKHYVTINNYLKSLYHKKVFKVALNGNFSCPNRDGTLSDSGCIFCSSKGSGDFAGEKSLTIREQFLSIVNKMKQKWPSGYYIAYFQANTNTYAPLEVLKENNINFLFEDVKIEYDNNNYNNILYLAKKKYYQELNEKILLEQISFLIKNNPENLSKIRSFIDEF